MNFYSFDKVFELIIHEFFHRKLTQLLNFINLFQELNAYMYLDNDMEEGKSHQVSNVMPRRQHEVKDEPGERK